MFDTMEMEFTKYSTKYGISYAPDMELAQYKVNRSFGLWHDLKNKVVNHESKVSDTNFQRIFQ